MVRKKLSIPADSEIGAPLSTVLHGAGRRALRHLQVLLKPAAGPQFQAGRQN
jgi:hypothetical protein